MPATYKMVPKTVTTRSLCSITHENSEGQSKLETVPPFQEDIMLTVVGEAPRIAKERGVQVDCKGGKMRALIKPGHFIERALSY